MSITRSVNALYLFPYFYLFLWAFLVWVGIFKHSQFEPLLIRFIHFIWLCILKYDIFSHLPGCVEVVWLCPLAALTACTRAHRTNARSRDYSACCRCKRQYNYKPILHWWKTLWSLLFSCFRVSVCRVDLLNEKGDFHFSLWCNGWFSSPFHK